MQQLHKILEEIKSALVTIGETSNAQSIASLDDALTDSILRVVVFGEFNQGKSTLINALLGRVVLPTKLIPTTGHITRIIFGLQEEVRVHFLNGHCETCALDRLDSFSSLNQDGVAREDVDIIEVAVNAPLLQKELILIDTPGLNDDEAQSARARRAIAFADLVLVVLNAQQVLNSSERSVIGDWLHQKLGKPVVPIVNFMNRVENHDKIDVRQRLNYWCHDNLSPIFDQPWFEINALGNLKHVLHREEVDPHDDFLLLQTNLQALDLNQRQALQHRARFGQLVAEARDLTEENQAVLERLRENAAKVKSERTGRQRDLQLRYQRFEADRAILHDRLSLVVHKALNKRLESLVSDKLLHNGKETLEEKAGKWYTEKLTSAARQSEKSAHALLTELAGDYLSRPDPLKVQERMALNARINVGELPFGAATDSAVGWGAGAGALIGTFVIPVPVLGTIIGGFAGGLLASVFGATAPNYGAAYAKQARDSWEIDARNLTNIALEQFDARATEMEKELVTQLEEVQTLLALPPSGELQQRIVLSDLLDDLIEQCERELQIVRENAPETRLEGESK